MEEENRIINPEEMQSPFDAIKEVDSEGGEWWNSRKLARLMGYQKYWNFEHLKDLSESKYKGRISFDRENLTGLFDVALARAQKDIREKGFNDPKYWASFILLDAFK